MLPTRRRRFAVAVVVSIVLLTAGGAARAGVTLKAVKFPGGISGESGTTSPPSNAPLSQRVVFEFDDKPKLGADPGTTLLIRVSATNALGQPVEARAVGTFEVSGKKVFFTPRLPVAEIGAAFGPASNPTTDASLPGLLPATRYDIDVDLAADGITNLKKVKHGLALPITFTTSDDPARWFANVGSAPPKDKPSGAKPDDGAQGVHPNTFADPAGMFDAIGTKKRAPFRIRFKGPLDPSAANISSDNVRLHAVKKGNGANIDAVLPADVALVVNRPDRADVLILPHGILPLGHVIAIEWSSKLATLAGVRKDSSAAPAKFFEASRFRVAHDPQVGPSILDQLDEEFTDTQHQDMTIAANGTAPAAWDAGNSGVLRATFGFGGDGSIGRFEPPNSVHTIQLDTDSQSFPLLDGSTPDAAPGTIVTGGVFSFSSFHVPPNVTLVVRGSRPVVFACTGDCTIEGRIDVRGANGSDDVTFDSALSRVPGGSAGPGGGRGGDGHPVVTTIGSTFLQGIQTPQFGQSGFGPGNVPGGGGGGGQSGCTLPWAPFTGDPTCGNSSAAGDGSRGAGGGGGSFQTFVPTAPENIAVRVSGRHGGVGIGDQLPIAFDPTAPIPAEPAAYDGVTANAVARPNPNPTFAEAVASALVFDRPPTTLDTNSQWATTKHVLLFGNAGPAVFADADPDNDFIGPGGEVTRLIGGQGGGGGGSRTEGLSQSCKPVIFDTLHLPFTTLDARGGSGGGAAGGILVQSLGNIVVTGEILATGGHGGGGEMVGLSSRGGAGGGGSGGAVLLQSAVNVTIVEDANEPSTLIDVSGGCANDAALLSSSAASGTTGGDQGVIQVGDGGPGGPGLVQIQVPPGAADLVDESLVKAKIVRSVTSIICVLEETIDPIVPRAATPAPFTSQSGALSTWYDLGAVTTKFRPSIQTSAGALAGPLFGIPGQGPFFNGTDAAGFVETDASGAIVTPDDNHFRVDSPDLGMPDFIPNGPTWFQNVRILFQGADEDAANPGSPDLATAGAFVGDPTLLNGKRFVRFSVTFDVAVGVPFTRSLGVPRPQVDFLKLPFRW